MYLTIILLCFDDEKAALSNYFQVYLSMSGNCI